MFAVQIICNAQLLNHCVFDSIHSEVFEESSTKNSVEDAKRYRLLDELKGHMARKNFYALLNFTHEVMGIG